MQEISKFHHFGPSEKTHRSNRNRYHGLQLEDFFPTSLDSTLAGTTKRLRFARKRLTLRLQCILNYCQLIYYLISLNHNHPQFSLEKFVSPNRIAMPLPTASFYSSRPRCRFSAVIFQASELLNIVASYVKDDFFDDVANFLDLCAEIIIKGCRKSNQHKIMFRYMVIKTSIRNFLFRNIPISI